MTDISNIDHSPSLSFRRNSKYLFAVSVVTFGTVLGVKIDVLDWITWFSEPENISTLIDVAGPVAVVFLLAVAVVVSPIPSGPIAMAAGALLGPVEGGLYTAAGSVVGAAVAFGLSQRFGYIPFSTSSFPCAEWITRPRTQYKLALIVLISRLIPFISFDIVSYIAGLTTLKFRNFVIATTFGVLPASFAFAAFGAGMVTYENTVLVIGVSTITLVPPLLGLSLRRFRKP